MIELASAGLPDPVTAKRVMNVTSFRSILCPLPAFPLFRCGRQPGFLRAAFLPQMSAQGKSVRSAILCFELFPVVLHVDELACDVVRALAGQEEGELELFFRRHTAREANLFGMPDFRRAGPFAGLEYFIRHAGIGLSGEKRVDLDVVVPNLFGQTLHKPYDCGFGGGIGRKIGARGGGTGAGNDDDLAAAPLDHLGQNGPAAMEDADHVGGKKLVPVARPVLREGANRALHGGVGDQGMDAAPDRVHLLNARCHLIVVRDVGANAESRSTGMLNFEFSDVKFALAAPEQPYTKTCFSEAEGETFSNAASGPGDQDNGILWRTQVVSLHRC